MKVGGWGLVPVKGGLNNWTTEHRGRDPMIMGSRGLGPGKGGGDWTTEHWGKDPTLTIRNIFWPKILFNPQNLLDVPFHITAPRGTCFLHQTHWSWGFQKCIYVGVWYLTIYIPPTYKSFWNPKWPIYLVFLQINTHFGQFTLAFTGIFHSNCDTVTT